MSLQVAETILEQLGGRRFVLMTGAKNLGGGERSLLFTLPARVAKNGINKVRITLEASDTYTVEFFKVRITKVTEIARVEDVYNDQLQEVFTEKTGLYTRL